MNIDRHNYEEYFILYLDNELSQEERLQVEAFATQHPDLREELDMLLQTKLSPDTTEVYAIKEDLLKQEAMPAYTELLLLHADNELSRVQQEEVNKLVSENKAAANLLKDIQQTKLQPDLAIVFPDKEALLKSSTPARASVVSMRWWRAAAAAVLLIGASVTVFSILNKSSETDQPSIAEGKITIPAKNIEAATSENTSGISTSNEISAVETENSRIVPANQEQQKTLVLPTANQPVYVAAVKEKDNSQTTGEIASMEMPTNNLPSMKNNPNARDLFESDKNLTAALSNDMKDALTNYKEINATQAVTPGQANPLHIINAASMETADPGDVAAESGKKNKLRGFFRKVTRTFEKATNIKATDDEDRLLIAGLAIKL